MDQKLNVKIIEAINSSEFEKPVKEFLVSALLVEYNNAEQDKPRIKEDYDRLIKKGASEMGEEDDID
nr:hypothetical protein [uncultured Methanobacterium sp.]